MSGDAHQDAQERQGADAPAGVASAPTVDAAAVLASLHRPKFSAWADGSVCLECRGRWRGDAETGGCESVLLARRVIALERVARSLGALLKDEWPSEYSLTRIADQHGRSDDDVRAVDAWERAQPWGWIGGG